MIENLVHCDRCPATKKEANHWFIAFRVNQVQDELVGISGGLTIVRWNEQLARHEKAIHLCGESCVQKTLSEFTGGK